MPSDPTVFFGDFDPDITIGLGEANQVTQLEFTGDGTEDLRLRQVNNTTFYGGYNSIFWYLFGDEAVGFDPDPNPGLKYA
ncbi:MAG: hypothetical protein AAGN64_15755, partial [Bacteroidota bacterium]